MPDKFRMLHWLGLAVAFYAMSLLLGVLVVPGAVLSPLQTLCWKIGNVTVAAYVGYFIDRHAFRRRITEDSTAPECIRRAIVMAAAMLAVSLGL